MPCNGIGPRTRADFYRDKTVVATEWWLCSCSVPNLVWARLRVFNDGTADACWAEGSTLYGFDRREFADFFLAEDEYTSFNGPAGWDAEDERETGVIAASTKTPGWEETASQPFEYLGVY